MQAKIIEGTIKTPIRINYNNKIYEINIQYWQESYNIIKEMGYDENELTFLDAVFDIYLEMTERS